MNRELSRVLEIVEWMPLSELTFEERSAYRRYQFKLALCLAGGCALFLLLSPGTFWRYLLWMGFLPILEPLLSPMGRQDRLRLETLGSETRT